MKSAIRKCALLLMTFTVWAKPALARSYLDCLTTKVVIVDAPSGNTSLSTEAWASGLMKRRKLSRSRMARRSSSAGLMIDGSALLAAMYPMNSIGKMIF
jgi:hypothetical protein